MITHYLVYSILENGNRIPGFIPVGSFEPTQWGPRHVVGHVTVSYSPDRGEPEGV